jgi:hypothetical protein
MPTTPIKAKKLLKAGKAKIVGRNPFTIQLLYGTRGYTQPVILGIDAGYENIGFSAVSPTEELLGGEIKMLKGMSERITERRKYRRTRRNRLRHRKQKFDNRRRQSGWLPPSIQHKLDTHLRFVERIKSRLPVTKVVVEVASFDIQKIKNPNINGKDYQQGEQHGWANLSAYIRHRDGYKCHNPDCKNKSSNPKLQVHHLGFWKTPPDRSDRPSNLICLCSKCHTPVFHKKGQFLYGWEPKLKSFKAETFMSIIYKRLATELGAEHTFGYITKVNRSELGLDKSHHNDAFVIAGGTTQSRTTPLMLEQTRRNNRALEYFYDAHYLDTRDKKDKPGAILFSGRRTRNKNLSGENYRQYRGHKLQKGKRQIRQKRYRYQPGDVVVFQGQRIAISGIQHFGTRVVLKNPPEGFPKSAATKKIQPGTWRKGICESASKARAKRSANAGACALRIAR